MPLWIREAALPLDPGRVSVSLGLCLYLVRQPQGWSLSLVNGHQDVSGTSMSSSPVQALG
jgi:hypothetical protein